MRNHLLTHPPLARLCAGVLASALATTIPVSVHAAPQPSESAGAVSTPETSQVRAALDDGDLTTARELAQARTEAAPTVANHQLEAEVHLALGDYQQAKRSLAAALELLPEDAGERAQINAQLAEIEAASRGTKPEEPASTHRDAIDQARADRLAALAPKPPPPPQVVDAPKPVSIAKKWYFWVTLGAIVASAGAIAGIAISSAVDDGDNTNAGTASAGAARQPIPAGGVMFRF
ncbi:hypothetical protein DB30_03052 [Enhygromyxa salina]|uniref:Uncharacterized protein n=1 Tax=Enhygromyxa salina TaxID=215803 RepID=A0A0C2D2T3_9BACT|nr:hypothetical protein [Enhygromyxa salina]KIG17571.1 hypothetical protein DB30_03052 [Enhygromyxa salina]